MLDLVRCGRFGRLFLGGLGGFGGVADDLVDDLVLGHPLVGEVDGQSLVQECHLLQSARHRLEVVVGGFEDVGVGPEPDGGSGLLGGFALLEGARHGVVVELRPLVPVAFDIDLETRRQRVDHRDADAVQTTADVVAAVLTAELAAGVQLRHDDVDGGCAGGVHSDRNTAAVVRDLDAAVIQQPDIDLAGVAGHGLVHRVVDYLPDKVVQAALTGGPDVHARAFADSLEAFENGDRRSAVFILCLLLLGSHGPNTLLGGSCRAVQSPQRSHTSLYRHRWSGPIFWARFYLSNRAVCSISLFSARPDASQPALQRSGGSEAAAGGCRSGGGVVGAPLSIHRYRGAPCQRCAVVPCATTAPTGR